MRGYSGGCVTEYAPLVTTVCVANQGAAPAGPFLVRAAGYGGGSLEWNVAGLGAGEDLCLEMERAAFGEALVDANNDVLESDETNNAGYVAIPTPPPICTPTATPTPTATSTNTPTPGASPTETPTPTITPSPTSFRVIDLSITVNDSADPVRPGEVFQYGVRGEKVQPVEMVAPNVSMAGELSPAGTISFTGTYTVTSNPNLQCQVEASRFQCYSPYDPGTVQLEAAVDGLAGEGQVNLCATIEFNPPLGGGDPNPANNRDCEDTTVMGAGSCAIAGLVRLQGRNDNSGTSIVSIRLDTSLIDGTPMATTAGDGRFTVGNLTPGDYRVTAGHSSYLFSEDDSVACQSGQTTMMPETTLLAGDANDDRVIDLLDLVIIGAAYRTCSGEPAFDRRADINATGCVDLLDLVLAAINFRRSGPTPWGMTPPAAW
jgi:hypothetical protein